jgi:DNA helicase HerA-like ATPase
MAVSVLMTIVVGAGSFGINLSDYLHIIIPLAASLGVMLLIFSLRSVLSFFRYKNKVMEDKGELGKLLGLRKITIRERHLLASNGSKLVGHAYFRINNIPYLLDDLDKEKKMWSVGNFVRIISTLNFPFELIPRIMPVPASVYLNQINKEIDNLKLTLSAEGRTASPRREARLKYLERIAERLLEGEGTRDVSFLCHILVEGKTEDVIVRELEANAKTLMSALESGLNVRAERLTGARMLEVLREFFRATVKVNPPKANRMLTWDLAYLIPLAKPKLPPLEKLLSGVYIGRTTAGGVVCLDIKRYANPHVVVLGKSGYGKSTTVKTLTARMFDLWESNILIIDYAGEYAPWVSSRGGSVIDMQTSGINPFELGKATMTDRMRQLVDTFSKLSELTLPQRNVLQFYLTKAYESKGYMPSDAATWKNTSPTMDELIDLIEADLPKFRMGKQLTAMALIEKLSALSSGPMGIFRRSTFSVSELTQGFVCIDLSKVTSTIMKDMVAYTILQHVDSEMRLNGIRTGVKLAIVLDEAWKLCRDEDSLPVTIIKEGRKYAYSLIVSSQDATADLAESILANAGTAIIHHTEHPTYLRFFEQSYGLTKQEIGRIQNAPVGEALIKIGDDPRPFFVRVEMEDASQEIPFFQPSITPVGVHYEESTANIADSVQQAKISEEPIPENLSDNARKLLEAVAKEPGNTTTEYYNMIGVNAYHGNWARAQAVELGLLEGVELPKKGKGRGGKTLRLTQKGRDLLGIQADSREGGVVHKSMIRLIAKKFEKHKVQIEYPVGNGKTTDVVIDGRIAIEVETRDFSESNIRKNLSAGFKKVIVVCQDKRQANAFQLKAGELFPKEKRLVITDLATLASNPKMVTA